MAPISALCGETKVAEARTDSPSTLPGQALKAFPKMVSLKVMLLVGVANRRQIVWACRREAGPEFGSSLVGAVLLLESPVLTELGDGLTVLHVDQQVGEAADPGGESCGSALGIVGGVPALQELIQQPAQGAGAILIWRLRKTNQGIGCLPGSRDVELNEGQRKQPDKTTQKRCSPAQKQRE